MNRLLPLYATDERGNILKKKKNLAHSLLLRPFAATHKQAGLELMAASPPPPSAAVLAPRPPAPTVTRPEAARALHPGPLFNPPLTSLPLQGPNSPVPG